MASSSSSSTVKFVFQSINGKIFEVYEAVAKQFVTIEQLIEDRLTRIGLVVIPNVSGNILAKTVKYCNHVLTKPPSMNNDEQTLFGLLVAADYLDIKGLLSLSCEHVLDMVKRKDLAHIRRLFNITPQFSPEEDERMRTANPWAFN
ncbi:hypothetical protein M9H77_26937 [Catharanthus roseus]|uniref:Uncharacterized protein n=1 Tax=Catharanthus roseus TaxID=4058 RepID=A0ACC0ABZ5_CATRO|nr:hypothetical protein M9H77_26937 [Catharanthus roseus]